MIFVALLVAPLVDEIVGGYQFRSMCARDAVLKVDAEEVRGKLLKRSSLQSFPAGTLLPVERWAVWYVDPASNRELLRYNWLRVSGGLLIRTLGISQNNSPLTIDPSSCSPKLDGPLEAKYGFSLINN